MQARRCMVLAAVLLFVPAAVKAQTASTATIVGMVTDATGAVIPGADVTLEDVATALKRGTLTNAEGQYTFVNVTPGDYKITVALTGFKQGQLSLKVEVAKSYTVNVPLQVGEMTETVQVTATGVELQTLDSTVGNVVQGEKMILLPNINRSALVYFELQPLIAPRQGAGTNTGGQVAGARQDQTSFTLDGVDVSNNLVGGDPYIPVPAESIEEFRVGTTNPNATYSRGSGGQFAMVTKRGGNAVHGSVYWYHQNDNLNANTWSRNRLRQKNPELKDNRFGVSAGGPIWKDHTFFYLHYEGRRYPQSTEITRLTPRDSMRNGILRFRDTSGVVRDYALATSTMCGANNNSACDPRHLGMSPAITALWRYMPAGNDATLGDGLNTIGFRSVLDSSTQNDFGLARFDHNFSDRWRFDVSYRLNDSRAKGATQADIGGLLPGHQLGVPGTTRYSFSKPSYFVTGLTGQVTPKFTNELRAGYMRAWSWSPTTSPFPQVPGTVAALMVSGESAYGGLLDDPMDVHTQRSRTQGSNQKIYQLTDNVSWIKRNHFLQFGGNFRMVPLYHYRNDKTVGSVTALVAEIDASAAVTIPPGNRPPDCSASRTTNCISSGNVTRWNRLYAGMTGMIDNVSILLTRDKNLKNLPFGTALEANTRNNAFELYFSDTWRVRPWLTITPGVNYAVQMAPVDKNARTSFMIEKATGKVVKSKDFLEQRRRAALQGDIYNPTLAWLPVSDSGTDTVFNTDWNNVAPRIAAAWNPQFESGLLGKLFGKNKTVVRGGYGVTYDRFNTVWSVIEPMLNPTFAQTINCRGPIIGGTCANVSDPTNAYRVGVDGPGVLPPVPPVSSPLVVGTPFAETQAYQPDSQIHLGYSHSIDFTIQRELRANFVLEVGYAGRLARNLSETMDINSAPYFMKDKASGQSFAVAFDAVADQLRSGTAASSVTPQPWFENQIGAGGTVKIATSQGAAFRDGMLRNLWTAMQFMLPNPNINMQVQTFWNRTDGGYSNYHAFFASLRKRSSHGIAFDLNYTLSKSLDLAGVVQNSPYEHSSSYDPRIDYGPSLFDARHAVSLNYVYELPFGTSGGLNFGRLNKALGGLYVSGILVVRSGLPITVMQSNQAWGGGDQFNNIVSGAIPISRPEFGNDVHSGITGSGGVGTNSNASTGGTGLNLFGDPETVFKNFRRIRISQDTRSFRGVMRGLPYWNVDMSFGKRTKVSENVRVNFTADFLNVFNKVIFNNPTLNLLDPGSFGVLSSQLNSPRSIQLGFRVEF